MGGIMIATETPRRAMPRPESPVGVSGLDAMLEEIKAVEISQHQSTSKTGKVFSVREHDDSREKHIREAAKWVHRYAWDKTLKGLPHTLKADHYLRQFKPKSPVRLYRFEREDHDSGKGEVSGRLPLQSWTYNRQMAHGVAEMHNEGIKPGDARMVVQERVFNPEDIYTDFTQHPDELRDEIEKHGGESSMQEVVVWHYSGNKPTSAVGDFDLDDIIRAATSELQERPSDTDVSVKAIIYDAAGRILVLESSHNDWHDLPGGHLHKGEDIETGLRREIREETGLEIGPITQTGPARSLILGHKRTVVLFYRAEALTDVVTLSDEHNSYRWVDPKAIDGLNLGVFFRPVQEALDQMPEPEDLSHHETVRAAAEKVYDGAISLWLGNLGAATTAAVFAHPPAGGGMPAIQGAIAGAAAGFAVVIAGAGRAAYTQAATALRADAGAHVQPTAEDAEAFTRQRAPLLEAFPEDVKVKVTTSLQRGIAAGEDTRAIARRVREAIEEVQSRADVVGETEAQVAYGVAQTEALKLVGYTSKAWISVRDERVRDSHVACDQQGAIPVDAPFANGLMHPGDPNGPPEEICGCRCHLEGRGDRSAMVTAAEFDEKKHPRDAHGLWTDSSGAPIKQLDEGLADEPPRSDKVEPPDILDTKERVASGRHIVSIYHKVSHHTDVEALQGKPPRYTYHGPSGHFEGKSVREALNQYGKSQQYQKNSLVPHFQEDLYRISGVFYRPYAKGALIRINPADKSLIRATETRLERKHLTSIDANDGDGDIKAQEAEKP